MNVTTTKSEQVWQSSDGQRTIWEVTLKATDDGKEYKLKTYSAQVATEGWEGEVRSYVNPRGDRFVRKVGDDKTDSNNTHGGGRDESAIKAQWAIGQAINLASVKMDKEQITLPVIIKYAKELYGAIAQVQGREMSEDERLEGDAAIEGRMV